MPTKEDVLVMIEAGVDYAEAGRRLGVPAGQAYLIATGVPADGSDSLAPEDLGRRGLLPGTSQHLVNPKADNPTKKEHVLEWVASRARRDHQMAEAARGRDAEPGEIVEPEDTDVVTVIGRDHNQVKALLEQLSAIPGVKKGGSAEQRARRGSIVDMVTVRLSRHEAVEERMLWPRVRSLFADGDRWADAALAQEQQGKDTLTALGKLGPDDERFDELVEQLVEQARTHVALEDKVLLSLRQVMDEEDRAKLGRKVRSAEGHGPTRPHPHAPSKPPGVQVAGAVGAAMDAVRDAVGDRPAKRKGTAGPEDG